MADIIERRKTETNDNQIHRRSMIAAVKRLHKAGQKAKEIADYLGIPESKVKKILFDR